MKAGEARKSESIHCLLNVLRILDVICFMRKKVLKSTQIGLDLVRRYIPG